MEHKRDMDRYFEGYQQQEITTPQGRKKWIRVYQGDYYSFDIQGQELHQMRRTITTYLGLTTVLYGVLWALPTCSSYSVLVWAVMAVMVFPLIYCWRGLFSFLTAKAPFVVRYTHFSLPRIKTSAQIMRICALCLCASDFIYLILNRGEGVSSLPAEIGYPVICILMFLLSFQLVRLAGCISFVNLGKNAGSAME